MTTLLVLGSKPDPALPPTEQIDAVACANASGFSAERHGLPRPTFTVMSSILASSKNASNRLALEAVSGLSTETLYLYPRAPFKGNPIKKFRNYFKTLKTQPFFFQRELKSFNYSFNKFVAKPLAFYIEHVKALAGNDERVVRQIAEKVPSTGMVAIALGVQQGIFDRIIVSGFSFEITHAYVANPLIDARGTTLSKHADTDVTVLKALSDRHGCIFTTETVVNERTGVPMLKA